MNEITNCVSNRALILRALKTMPFGLLLAWAYLSVGILSIYITWQALRDIGWPTWQWIWWKRAFLTLIKWTIAMFTVSFIFNGFFINSALNLPVKKRWPTHVDEILVTVDELRPPFSRWEWLYREIREGYMPYSTRKVTLLRAALVPPERVARHTEYLAPDEPYIQIFIERIATYSETLVAWGEIEEGYGTKPVSKGQMPPFRSRYACAWRVVEGEGYIAYYAIYDEFVVTIDFNDGATQYSEAMYWLLERQDRKIGRWIERTRTEPPPRP